MHNTIILAISDIDNSDLQHVGGSCIQAFLAAMGGPKSD